MLSTTTDNVDKHLSINELEDSKIEFLLEEKMERETISIRENKTNKKVENVPESFVIQQIKLSRFNIEKQCIEDGRRKTPNDEKILEILSSYKKDYTNSNGLDIKNKTLDKKTLKQLKVNTCNGLEKETCATLCAKFVGINNDDFHPLEGLLESKSNKKVQESLDTFIRQTMGHEAYMSFNTQPSDKPFQKIIEHQQAMDKCIKNLKIDINICDGLENNSNLELHKIDIESDPSSTKSRQLIIDQNQQTIKSSVPLTIAALATVATKNPNLSSWPLLSPSKVQLQKCEKCSCEFFSPLNYWRHTRTYHRRINYVDKEDLTLKRKNIVAFWNKLNLDEAQQIFENSRKYDFEDLSGEVVLSNLIAFKRQKNPITLPPMYLKAGHDLLDMLDKRQSDFLLSSEKILSILDEASERTFLCSQGEVNKIGLEEKNLVASLGYIVEQTLIKAWMVNKDAEALRNQQELFKEEEAAQMKRVKNVARKKRKKEKSRQKVLKERKFDTTQLILNEENELIDGENPSLEIVEEDNSPTASSTSANSSGLENQLLEPSKMEINVLIQSISWRDHDVCGDDRHLQKLEDICSVNVTSKRDALGHVAEDQMQQSSFDIISNADDQEQYSKSHSINQGKVEDQRKCIYTLKQDQSVVESRKRVLWRPYKESISFDYQDSHQRGGWIPNLRFQEGTQQNTYKTLRKPSIGTPYISNNERSNSPLLGFYHGKSTNLRGTIPFLTTQQWAKKAHISTSLEHTKNGKEDEDFQEYKTQKDNIKDVVVGHAILVCGIDADKITNINRIEKESESRNFEKNEFMHVAVPLAKVVASTGGNMAPISFNFNANSEDWPPLSNSCASIYSKNSRRYPWTSYQCELKAKSKKFNIESGIDYQTRLESKVEGSNHLILPSTKDHVNYTTSGSMIIGRQRGILIGSISIPLGDNIHQSRLKIESTSRRIYTPLQANQSYTFVLAAPMVQYNQDSTTNTIGQQKRHEEINFAKFEESSNMQVIDSFGGPSQYRTSMLRSTPSVNFSGQVKGPTFERTYTYPLGDRGDRGIISKQPPWSNGPIRHVPQKIWRPVQSTIENFDSKENGRTNIEGNIINEIENIHEVALHRKHEEPLRSINEVLFRSETMQVRNMDINKVEHCSTLTTNIKAQLEDKSSILDSKSVKESANPNVLHLDKSMVLDTQHLQCQNESIQVASIMSKDDIKSTCQSIKSTTSEQKATCIFQNKIDDKESIANKAFVETTLSNSTWIAEVVEYHLNRWHAAMKDPETIISECEMGNHHELQTSIWSDFMKNQPSLSTESILKKEDTNNQIFYSCNQIGTKKSRNLQNEQMSTNTQNSIIQEGSGVCLQGALIDEEFQQDFILACESRSLCGIGSTLVEVQNHEKNDNEGQIGFRCSSCCSNSSLSSNNQIEKQDWIGAMSTNTQKRPQGK